MAALLAILVILSFAGPGPDGKAGW